MVETQFSKVKRIAILFCLMTALHSVASIAQQCDGASVGTYTFTCDDCQSVDPNGTPHCSFSGNVQLKTYCQADSWRIKTDYPLQQVTGGGASAGCDAPGPARCPAIVTAFQIYSVSGTTITVNVGINDGEVQGSGCSNGIDASFSRQLTGQGCCASVCADSTACTNAGRVYSNTGCVCSAPPSCIPDESLDCTTGGECCSGLCGADGYCGCDDALCQENYGGVCEGGVCSYASPVLIPMGTSEAYQLTSASAGVVFDIFGSGRPIQTAWTKPDEELAFLAMDRNGDGRISSGHELFGNNTIRGATNGFAALAALTDHIGASYISSDDAGFQKLLLWTDRNHNGISEPDELQPASNVIRRIGLIPIQVNRRDGDGNLFRYRSWVELTSGRTIYVYDVILKVTR